MRGCAASLCPLWMEMNGGWLDQRRSWRKNFWFTGSGNTCDLCGRTRVKTNDIFWWWKMGGEGGDGGRHMICPDSDKAGCVLSGDDCCVCEASCISWCSPQTGGAVCADLGLHFTQAAMCSSSSAGTFVYVVIVIWVDLQLSTSVFSLSALSSLPGLVRWWPQTQASLWRPRTQSSLGLFQVFGQNLQINKKWPRLTGRRHQQARDQNTDTDGRAEICTVTPGSTDSLSKGGGALSMKWKRVNIYKNIQIWRPLTRK